MSSARLDLYGSGGALGCTEPIGYIDPEGVVHFNYSNPPQIVFADVPVRLHLSLAAGKGITLAPLSEGFDSTETHVFWNF